MFRNFVADVHATRRLILRQQIVESHVYSPTPAISAVGQERRCHRLEDNLQPRPLKHRPRAADCISSGQASPTCSLYRAAIDTLGPDPAALSCVYAE